MTTPYYTEPKIFQVNLRRNITKSMRGFALFSHILLTVGQPTTGETTSYDRTSFAVSLRTRFSFVFCDKKMMCDILREPIELFILRSFSKRYWAFSLEKAQIYFLSTLCQRIQYQEVPLPSLLPFFIKRLWHDTFAKIGKWGEGRGLKSLNCCLGLKDLVRLRHFRMILHVVICHPTVYGELTHFWTLRLWEKRSSFQKFQ